MKTTFTPGPWTIGSSYGNNMVEIDGAEGNAVAAVWIARGTSHVPPHARTESPELQANAALIAAAPDLLAELESLIADWERVHGAVPPDHEAIAAIAKAKGQA